ncbi:formate C-acetyltransferase/glycerol dehydratase family glycyl radical enzyme, partial [Desulfovibrio sp. OttesenSCG-928-G15]|nr:formate C-acetyltransferase/glycerol dehydratase family glycyl radical enzyme [Desulfovibrio sp. OttesenSCG-928-G15]
MAHTRPKLPQRLQLLKEAYLRVKPSISIGRALAYTEVTKAYPDLPRNLLRAKCFRRACETAPIVIADHELIVGHPCGKARAGAFSPDTAWQWVQDELDTIATRSQDPYQISEEDKKVMRDYLFPFWEGKSLAESCEAKLRQEGLWEFGAEACVSDLTYHITSGGGDTSPGYDIILFTKGILGVKAEAEAHIARLTQKNEAEANQEKTTFYSAALETCEGILAYASRLSEHALALAGKEQ